MPLSRLATHNQRELNQCRPMPSGEATTLLANEFRHYEKDNKSLDKILKFNIPRLSREHK